MILLGAEGDGADVASRLESPDLLVAGAVAGTVVVFPSSPFKLWLWRGQHRAVAVPWCHPGSWFHRLGEWFGLEGTFEDDPIPSHRSAMGRDISPGIRLPKCQVLLSAHEVLGLQEKASSGRCLPEVGGW